MPSEANGKVLMSIMNPDFFLAFVLNSREQFSEDDFAFCKVDGEDQVVEEREAF